MSITTFTTMKNIFPFSNVGNGLEIGSCWETFENIEEVKNNFFL